MGNFGKLKKEVSEELRKVREKKNTLIATTLVSFWL